jgi:hypothetical protein
LLEQAKQYAREHDTTLTRLITAYLGQITAESAPANGAPIVKRLSGSLSQDVAVEDYRRYLEEKHGRPG